MRIHRHAFQLIRLIELHEILGDFGSRPEYNIDCRIRNVFSSISYNKHF